MSVVARRAMGEESASEETRSPPALQERFGNFGWMETELWQVRPPDDQTLVVRGKLRNPYEQRVEGVRLIVRLLTAGNKRELDRIEVDLDVVVEPGKKFAFSRELATNYSKVFTYISVAAFAIRRGANELPAPSRDVVSEAGNSTAAAYNTATIPLVYCPIVPLRFR